MTILMKSLAVAAAFAASTALAQTSTPTVPAKPDAAPQAGQACPNGWMMAQGQMMRGQHMGGPGGPGGPGAQGAKPGTMMPNGMMMGRNGAYCMRQGSAAAGAAPPAVPAPKAK